MTKHILWEQFGAVLIGATRVSVIASQIARDDHRKTAQVVFSVNEGHFSAHMNITPAQARELASSLQHAANRVDEVNRETQGYAHAG